MKLLKRNQIIILVVALMLVSAGYLNYTSMQNNNIIETSSSINEIDYAGIGDAKLVSSDNVIENVTQNEINNEVSIDNNTNNKSNVKIYTTRDTIKEVEVKLEQ